MRRGPWFREHQRRPGIDAGCWYFASLPRDPARESGRFDLGAPEGTCYFGDSAAVSAMERVGRFTATHRPVPADLLTGRVISAVDGDLLPRRAANLASRVVSRLGVTGELFTMSDYSVPQRWAAAIRGIGHEAVLYPPRFSPGAKAIACFGPAGPASRPVLDHTPLRRVLDRIGVWVADVPASGAVTIIRP